MKKILIVGAQGNLGKYAVDYFVEFLPKDFEIIAAGRRECNFFDRYGIKYIVLDIEKPDTFSAIPDDIYAVVDLAGVLPAHMAGYFPRKYFDVNTIGTLNLLNYCKEHGVKRFVYTQTWADLNGYLNEGEPLHPYSLPKTIYTGDHAVYAISKNAAVELIKHYHYEYGMDISILRLPNIYLYSSDPYYFLNGQKIKSSYRIMIDRAIKGQDIELWGDKNKGKDIVYVKDFAQLLFKSTFSNIEFGIYNVGTGKKTTMLQQINGIIDVFCPYGCRSRIIECPDKPSCDDFVMDIKNAETDLGYIVKYDYMRYLEDFKNEMMLNRF